MVVSDNAFGTPAVPTPERLRQRGVPVRVAQAHNSRSGGRVGRFESTAPWYARYRPRYPAELIERLVRRCRARRALARPRPRRRPGPRRGRDRRPRRRGGGGGRRGRNARADRGAERAHRGRPRRGRRCVMGPLRSGDRGTVVPLVRRGVMFERLPLVTRPARVARRLDHGEQRAVARPRDCDGAAWRRAAEAAPRGSTASCWPNSPFSDVEEIEVDRRAHLDGGVADRARVFDVGRVTRAARREAGGVRAAGA